MKRSVSIRFWFLATLTLAVGVLAFAPEEVSASPADGENVVCVPDPDSLNVAGPTTTIAVDYLGGGSGLVCGYSVTFTWDDAVVSTSTVSVTEGTLLSSLGLAPQFTVTADHADEVSAELRYRIDPVGGPWPTGKDDRQGVAGSTLLGLASDSELSDTGRQEARRLLRGILAHHLGDRPLKSRELFQSLYLEKA